jgi:peptide/nickel transport system ATP-binding protein
MPLKSDTEGSEEGAALVSPPLLDVRDLEVSYLLDDREIAAVKGFSLTVREGEFVGLVGESGCGKSTAALALLGLVRVPGRIVRGQAAFFGRDLLGMSEEELREVRGRMIGLVVQNPRGALNPLTRVGHQIANVYRAHHDVDKREAHVQAVSALRRMGIDDADRRATAYPHQFSGGMAQRVMIAMATINEPKLLIADEPTTGLDVTVQAQILDLLRSKVLEASASVLFVTHDLGIVAHYCDRVAVMWGGRIVEEATTAALFVEPKHPYTQKLLASVPTSSKKGRLARS